MFHLYAMSALSSIKALIALEELGAPYALHREKAHQGDRKTLSFLARDPGDEADVFMGKVRLEGDFSLCGSAAILVYLGEKYGRLLPINGLERARVFEQLFFHASDLGPAFGQSGYFQKLAPEILPLAIRRFHKEAQRVTSLLDSVLAERPYVAGTSYTIADIAHFGWLWRRTFANIHFDGRPHLARWYEAVASRPAAMRAISAIDAAVFDT